MAYKPSGQPVADLALDTSSMALVAAGPSDFLLFSPDGQTWAKRDTLPLGSGHGLETKFAGPGYYVVASIKASARRGLVAPGGDPGPAGAAPPGGRARAPQPAGQGRGRGQGGGGR